LTLASAWELALYAIANERAGHVDDLALAMLTLWPEEWHVC